MAAERTNPSESPTAPGESAATFLDWLTSEFVLAVLFNLALLIAIGWTRGEFLELYAQFEIELPSSTLIAISPVSLVAVGLLLLATIIKQFTLSRAPLVRRWNMAVCFLSLLLAALYFVAIMFPLVVPGIKDFR